MNIVKTSSKSRAPLVLLAFTGLALNSTSALAADLPYDTQARIQAVLAGTPQGYTPIGDEAHFALENRDSASPIEFQALVRRSILGTPGSAASQRQADALNATRISACEAQLLVQRTLQGGTG